METSRPTTNSAGLRFLVAKYVPDLRRMEPRNIGLILWQEGKTVARFLGEEKHAIVPPNSLKVESEDAYRQWVEYWRLQLTKKVLKTSDGKEVPKSSPQFVDALRTKSKQQYLLVDGGYLMTNPPPSEMRYILDELFEELIGSPKPKPKPDRHTEAAQKLHIETRKAIKAAEFDKQPKFEPNYEWLCPVEHTKKHFHFDYAFHDRKPKALISRLLLWEQTDVESLAFRFQCMRKAYDLAQEQCAAIVFAPPQILRERDVKEAKSLMSDIGTIINLAEGDAAVSSLRSIAPTSKNTSTACLRHHGSRQSSALRRLRDDGSSGS